MDKHELMKIQIKTIKRASHRMGSQAALARELNIYPQSLNRYYVGVRKLPLNLYLEKAMTGQ